MQCLLTEWTKGIIYYRLRRQNMESRKSVQNLAGTIHSLLGLKARFTSSWVKSVCEIVRNLPSEGPPIDLKSANFKTSDSCSNKDDELDTAISKIKGKSLFFSFFHVCRCILVCA